MMSLPPSLLSVCVVARSFPPEFCPADIARQISFATGTPVEAIASLGNASRGGGNSNVGREWLLRLRCHEDQKKCLLNYRRLSIPDGNRWFEVILHFPDVTPATETLQWVQIKVDMSQEMRSPASENMEMEGDNTEVMKPWRPEDPAPPPQRQMFIPPWSHDQREPPQYRGQGAEHPPTRRQSEPQGFSDRCDSDPYFRAGGAQSPPSAFSSHKSSPGLSTLGIEPRSDASSDASGTSSDMHAQQQPQQGHFLPRGPGGDMGMQGVPNPDAYYVPPGAYVGYPHYYYNYPGYAAHLQSPEGEVGPLRQGMANLGIAPPQQHQNWYNYHQPEHFQDARIERQDMEHPAGGDSESQHHVYLKVTALPEPISEVELKDFFQSRHMSGGGPIADISFSAATKSANIFFVDADDANRVVQRAPLLLKGKKIQVDVATQEDQEEQEAERKTVEVRGLEDGDSEMCGLYFSNPLKGGGEIEESQWKEKEKVFLITFKEAAVAQAVASKGHTVAGKVLEVSLYTPPAEEEDMPQCTILVRGIDPAQEELYNMYFSNPSKGGDNIVNLCISEDGTAMYITFETPEVAERLVERTHTVGGRRLEVVLAPTEQPTPPSTIIVKGCNLKNPDLYRLYFDNPNKGGGEISDLEMDEKQKAILITFCDPEVAQRLVGMEHTVGKVKLSVAMYVPEKSPPKRQLSKEPKEQPEEEEEPVKKTVVVTVGEQRLESEENYLLYFESARHGGGEVEEVRIDEEKKLVYITYCDASVAERVAKRRHEYNGRRMEVKLYVPPKPKPTYPDKLLFKNVADSTSRDSLEMFLERVTGLEPGQILYGDELGTVLVSFKEEPDLEKTMQCCQKRTLERRTLMVSKVAISNCLLVENLNPVTTEDTVKLYFENRRSKGGQIEKVELISKEKKCFVYFEDHSVLDGVLSIPHKLDGSDLVVKRYMECLGLSGGSEDPTAFTMPKPVTIDTVDPYKIAYLRQSRIAQTDFLKELSQNHAKGTFTGDTVVLECTLTSAVSKARILAHTWTVDIKQTVENYVRELEVHRQTVMQQLWEEVEKAVSSAGHSQPDKAILFTLAEETAFVVVGMKNKAQELFKQVATTIKTAEETIERRNQEVTETNNKLKNYQLRLLLAMGFHTEAEKRHDGLKVEIQLKKNCIVFHGLVKDVKEAQVEMYEVIQPIKSDKMTKLSHMQKKLLDGKDVKPHIVQKFKKQNVVAVWELDAQGQVVVFAFTDESLVEAIHIINKSVPEHVCKLTPESVQLLNGHEWGNVVQRLISSNAGVLLIETAQDDQRVYITCLDSIMHGAVEEIEVFFQENTIYTQIVRFSPSRQLFIHQEWHQRLINLQTVLQAYKVQIIMKDAGSELCVKGTLPGLIELRKRLEDLNAEIVCHVEKVTDMAKVRCLSSPYTDKDLKVLGQTTHSVLSLRQESADMEMISSGNTSSTVIAMPDMGNMQMAESIELRDGVTIAAILGDITQLQVDVIVNAANDRMDHVGGLARDIVQKGGQIIQEESYKVLKARGKPLTKGDVLITGSGSLRCKAVVHAVGPVYCDGYSGEDDCLHDTVIQCITAATDCGHTSIAFPAISTGIFKFPMKEATRITVEAVKAYLDSHKKSKIRKVYLCHVASDAVQMFVDAIHRIFPSAQRTTSGAKTPAALPTAGANTRGKALPPKGFPAQNVIGVAIVEGEIASQKVDVIVNSTSNGLDLRNGAISASIFKTAGQGLQDECKQQYPKGIETGDIARTSGHALACKYVFHLALCNWQNLKAQQVLESSMTKCLSEATKLHCQSIAFPVLGIGNLGYPLNVVVETMLQTINQFQQTTPFTSLRSASIIVHHSQKKNVQVFKDMQKKMGVGGLAFPPPKVPSKSKGNRKSRRFSEQGQSQAKPMAQSPVGAVASAVYEIGKLKLVIKRGDITEEAVDAIVNSSNSKLDLSKGSVASALKTKGGDRLDRECRAKVHDLQARDITHTNAYNMNSRVILHINSDRFNTNWSGAYKVCLEEAKNLDVQTLALPALGTGAYGLSASQSAAALFDVLVNFIPGGLRSLTEVRVVLFDHTMIPQFVTVVEEMGKRHTASSNPGGLMGWFKSATGGSAPSVEQAYVANELREATLYIYTGKQAEIPNILRAFDDLVKERFYQKELADEVLLTMSPEEIEQIYQLGVEHKVVVKVNQARGQVLVDGLQKDVFEALQKIQQILREVERTRQELQSASMLANMVQWSFLEVTATGTEPKQYNQKENQIIEKAFSGKKKNVEISDIDGIVYVIDFDAMMEYQKDDPSDTVGVLRQDKLKEKASGALPDSWAPHGPNEHVKVVPLKSSDKEYKDVEAEFRKTLGNRNITVTGVERVQNRTLFQQYSSKKAHLEKQNQGIQNEKTLWHGTAVDAISSINNYGFNRSYCGKNAFFFGQGVYFAVHSEYSTRTTYSQPDSNGTRYIYQCKVLVGHSVKGDEQMRFLPARKDLPPKEGHVLYDSATNDMSKPVMYVIFNDTQAYPEYLITFTGQ